MSNDSPTLGQQAAARRTISLDAAVDSIAKYFEFEPIVAVDVDGEVFEVRFSVAQTPEQVKAFEELDKYVKTLDHEDIPNRHAQTGEILLHPKTGEVDAERVPKIPHQFSGQPIEPTYGFRYLTAMFGSEERAQRAQDAGLTFNLVQALVGKMGDQWMQFQKKREVVDPKSR